MLRMVDHVMDLHLEAHLVVHTSPVPVPAIVTIVLAAVKSPADPLGDGIASVATEDGGLVVVPLEDALTPIVRAALDLVAATVVVKRVAVTVVDISCLNEKN